jgi:hypothetical protein
VKVVGQLIVTIDPGLRDAGAVAMDKDRVHATMNFASKPGDGTMADTLERAFSITHVIYDFVQEVMPDVVVIEGWEDQFYKGPMSNAWGTVAVIAYLGASFPNAVWQLPSEALIPTKDYRDLWKARGKKGAGILLGDNAITNAHLRSAASHGVYYFTTH